MTGMKIDKKWKTREVRLAFDRKTAASFANVSGGRTSGMMHALLGEHTIANFQNTGKEHERTYEFIEELAGATGRPILWLEYRPPRVRGAPPREAGFAIVDFKTADRTGAPFEAFLQTLADFRATKGLGPIAPWARGRLCTAQMKHRVKDAWARSLGCDVYETFVGLRSDEPRRVAGLRGAETRDVTMRVPLYDAGIDESQVMEFWSDQSFDLNLPSELGNCTGCFLKDEADLSRVLGSDPVEAEFWASLGDRYPWFGGRRFPGYRQLAGERAARLRIESALRENDPIPVNDGSCTDHRYRLVVIQERKRLAGARAKFSCACEQSVALANDEEDQMSLWEPR